MNAGLRALLTGIIDYAGLFPPAKLPMGESVRNYLRYRDEPESWMLGRFICPASRLHELTEFHDEIGDRPLVVSALARGGESREAVLENLQADLKDIAACRERHSGRVSIDTLEMKVPNGSMADSRSAVDLLQPVGERTQNANLTVFFEVPCSDRRGLQMLHAALNYVPFARTPGYKLRAGGLEPSSFPSSEEIVRALERNYSALILFKATAGLHHPFPRYDESVQARMHGFINLFAAGMFCGYSKMPLEVMTELLDDSDPANFHFSDNGLTYRSFHLSAEQINQAREERYVSFGSCSFDEPRDDLRALGWL